MYTGVTRVELRTASEVAWRTAVVVAAMVLVYAALTRWAPWERSTGWQSTDDAYLQADLTPVASRAVGYLEALPMQDYARVRRGEVLARIVDDDYKTAVAR